MQYENAVDNILTCGIYLILLYEAAKTLEREWRKRNARILFENKLNVSYLLVIILMKAIFKLMGNNVIV